MINTIPYPKIVELPEGAPGRGLVDDGFFLQEPVQQVPSPVRPRCPPCFVKPDHAIMYVRRRCQLKTTLYVNRQLLEEAMALSNLRKITEVVNLALEEFVRRRRLEMLADRLGREDLALTLEDLEEMRRDE